MIIVAGHITVDAANRRDYLEGCRQIVALGRAAEGNLDFAISADLVEEDRINILERWESLNSLQAFRGSGPGDDQSQQIRSMQVRDYGAEERL